jgi:hypothetical protein
VGGMNPSTNAGPRIHRHTLVEMNRPVFTARRDAAHACVLEAMRSHIEEAAKEQRAAWYEDCLRLVEESVRSTLRSQIAQDSPLVHYLKLLREILKAQLALVNHEITLASETEEFSRLLGQETVARLLQDVHLVSDSERFVLDSIRNLLEFGEPLRARDTEERQREFAEDDYRRFQQALAEYGEHYRVPGL